MKDNLNQDCICSVARCKELKGYDKHIKYKLTYCCDAQIINEDINKCINKILNDKKDNPDKTV